VHDEDVVVFVNEEGDIHEPNVATSTTLPPKEESVWISLPFEMGSKILRFLGDIDMCGYIKMVSKSPFLPLNEEYYKWLCEITYLAQTSKKLLNIDRWRTWNRMMINRPRIRTNGFYCLKTLYTRAPCNDNFWEKKKVESIEMTYYRYMRFFNDGRVLYALNTVHPEEMAKQLSHGLPEPKKLFEGRYVSTGSHVDVEVEMHYCRMYFTLEISDADDGYIGKHNVLHLTSHACTSLEQQLQQQQYQQHLRQLAQETQRLERGRAPRRNNNRPPGIPSNSPMQFLNEVREAVRGTDNNNAIEIAENPDGEGDGDIQGGDVPVEAAEADVGADVPALPAQQQMRPFQADDTRMFFKAPPDSRLLFWRQWHWQ
jgi:hypothetical protein